MRKICFLIPFLIITFCDSNESTNIECSYTAGGFLVTDNIYHCTVRKDPNISTRESAQNCTITGIHVGSKSNDDVLGFYAGQKTIKIFPQGLEKSFKNLRRIYIDHCGMQEIHQSDLKPFPQLTHIYIVDIVEVIEEGLFDFNPNLEWIGFFGTDIIHIDSNVFDHLIKLTTFWFSNLPCVQKHISDSRDRTKEAIKLVKNQCSNSEAQQLKEQLINLEVDSKALSRDEFKAKFEAIEAGFIASRFAKYRPLNYKFEELRNLIGIRPAVGPTSKLEMCPKAENSASDLASNLKNISVLLLDIKSSLPSSKATITSKFNVIKSSVDQLATSQSNSASSIDVKLNSLAATQEAHKLAVDSIKESISDMEVTLSNLKTSQNDIKASISKIKTSQNENRIALDEIKGSKCENSGLDKEQLEAYFSDFEVKNAEKFNRMEQELANSRHKVELSLDEKIRGTEKRLMRKLEDFEERIGKMFVEKLESMLKPKVAPAAPVPQPTVSVDPESAIQKAIDSMFGRKG